MAVVGQAPCSPEPPATLHMRMIGAGGGKAHLHYLWFLGVLNISVSVQYDRYTAGLPVPPQVWFLLLFCSIFVYYATQHLSEHLRT